MIGAFLDGELNSGQAEELRAHLENCPDCQAVVRAQEAMSVAVQNIKDIAPSGLRERILQEARVLQAKPVSRTLNMAEVFARAAAVLVGAVSVGLLHGALEDSPAEIQLSQPPFQALVFESEAGLELGGSFGADFRALERRPEGRLLNEVVRSK